MKATTTGALNGQQELPLILLILENPSLYLGEMCKSVHEMTGLEVSALTLCRIIHRHGLTVRNKKGLMCIVFSSWLRSSYIIIAGSSLCG